MDAKPHFETLALYNRWANRRLYETAAALTETQFREDRGAFFKSICGTLNHILVADQIWLERIEGTGPKPSALDAVLHDRLENLRVARDAEDARLLRMVTAQPEERFAGTLTYRNTKGTPFERPFADVLTHIFNHQTHHRGQAHSLFTQFGLTAPVLDFLYFLPER